MTFLGTVYPACYTPSWDMAAPAYRHGKCRGAYLRHVAYLHLGAYSHRGDTVVSIMELTVIQERTAMDISIVTLLGTVCRACYDPSWDMAASIVELIFTAITVIAIPIISNAIATREQQCHHRHRHQCRRRALQELSSLSSNGCLHCRTRRQRSESQHS